MASMSRRMILTGYTALLLLVVLFCTSYTFNARRIPLFSPDWHTSSIVADFDTCSRPSFREQQLSAALTTLHRQIPLKRTNIAVASIFGYHFDVYMALVWTLQRTQSRTPGLRLQVFADAFHYGFEDIVDSLNIYHGERHGTDLLLDSIRRTDEGTIDLLILGTCEIDLRALHAELLAAWEERPDGRKFDIVCMVHNTQDLAWQEYIADWTRRGAFRLITLGDHVADSFKYKFDEQAESKEMSAFTAGFEGIPIDAHYPVLDIPDLPSKSPHRVLSKAVIQGSFDSQRRDYVDLFADLVRSLHEDPAAWGYRPLSGRTSFVPDPSSPHAPFELALFGSGALEVPEELAYMVAIHRDLDYRDFYRLISDADVIVPAFAYFLYYKDMASSTVALAVELDVPILATQRMRKAYGYIDDDRVVVTRPAAMREVQALKALRTGNASFFLDSDPTGTGRTMGKIRGLNEAVQSMLDQGWFRDKADTRAFKEQLWRGNEVLAERLIRDM